MEFSPGLPGQGIFKVNIAILSDIKCDSINIDICILK